MITRNYLTEQIERMVERLGQTQRKVASGQVAAAVEELERLLEEGESAWERELPADREPLRLLLSQLHSELGLAYGMVGAHDEGFAHIEKGLELLGPAVERGDERAKTVRLAMMLNAGAAYAAARQLPKAVELLDEVLAGSELRPGQADADVQRVQRLRLAALQNRAMAREQSGQLAAAATDLGEAREAAKVALAGKRAEQLTMEVELSLRLANTKRRGKDANGALAEAERALEAATTMAKEHVGAYPLTYVRSKLAVAELSFGANRLGDGEDQLFEAIDAIPELVDSVLAGVDMYAELLTLPDERLEAGGLPREEVVESFSELLAKLDARCEDAEVRNLVRARFDLLVNDDAQAARLERSSGAGQAKDPRINALRLKLAQALTAWEKAHAN